MKKKLMSEYRTEKFWNELINSAASTEEAAELIKVELLKADLSVFTMGYYRISSIEMTVYNILAENNGYEAYKTDDDRNII